MHPLTIPPEALTGLMPEATYLVNSAALTAGSPV